MLTQQEAQTWWDSKYTEKVRTKRTTDALVVGYGSKFKVKDDSLFLALSNWVNGAALY